jgi:transcriptional regulator with XRE-family HTH domain
MQLGEKIKRIRQFRGLTQQELGEAIGLDVRSANTRIGQYEIGFRVPKEEMLASMAEALNVNIHNFTSSGSGDATDIMENFFWLDEENRNIFHLVRFARFPKEKNNAVKDPVVYYHQTDDWPAESPVGMWMDYGLVNQFLKEWEVRREQLVKGEITNAEYFEWKIGWPETASDVDDKGNDLEKPAKKWRKDS